MSIGSLPGITVITGANGTGKTHLLKLIYSACAITTGEGRDFSFAQKIVSVFRPYENRIGRLAHRQSSSVTASVNIETADKRRISYKFSNHTREAVKTHSISQLLWKRLEITSAFIPVKEMLAHAPGFVATTARRELAFEDVYSDILKLAYLPKLKGPLKKDRADLLEKLQKTLSGKVTLKGEYFFLRNSQGELEFSLLAEGIRKLALVWLLIQNGTLLKGSILLWDEPEANLNPALMEQLVEVIFQLQRNGVQVILTTHNNVLMRYLDLKKTANDSIEFLNLTRNSNGEVNSNSSGNLSDLANVSIKEAVDRLYDVEVRAAINLGL